MELEEAEEVIYDLLHPTAKWLLNHDVDDLIDLEKVTYLVNTLKEDPVGSVAAITRMVAISKQAYGRLKEAYEDVKLQRDQYFSVKMEEATRKESVFKDQFRKDTQAAMKAWIENTETFMFLDEKCRSLAVKKDRVWQLVEHLEFQGEQMRALLGIYSELPVTGEVLSPGEVKEIVAKFRHQIER